MLQNVIKTMRVNHETACLLTNINPAGIRKLQTPKKKFSL